MSSPTRATSPAIASARPLFGGYPLVAACVAWVAGIALERAGPWAALPAWMWLALAGGCLAAMVALHLLTRGRRIPTTARRTATRLALAAAILGLCLALGAARAAWANPGADAHAISQLPRRVSVQLRGAVVAEPILEADGRLLVVEASQASLDGGTTWQPAVGRVEVHLAGPDDWFAPGYGDTLQLTGKLAPAQRGAPVGVVARLTGARAQIEARGGGNPLLAWLFDLRVRLAESIQRTLPEPEAALLIGILLGLKTPVLRARLKLFTTTGTIHLVVPAGLKVSLLADIARRTATPLGRWAGTLASLLAVACYAALGGGGPAALRAAIMGGLLAIAPALGRRYDLYAALALAALVMTASEPLLIYDAGFQLTMLATLGIPLLTPSFQRGLLRPLARLPRATAALTPIAELLAVTLAAQLATLPVLGLSFNQISLVAPLANLLAVPLLAPLLVLGAALAAVSLAAPPFALGVALVTWPLLWLTDRAIEWCAALPAAALPVAALPAWAAWAYYVLLAGIGAGAWWLARWRRASRTPASAPRPAPAHVSAARGSVVLRWTLVVLAALVLLGGWGAAAPALAAPASRLDFLDVGPGGAATLLRLPDGTTALIDGGPSGPPLEEALAARLPFWQRSLDLALLTDARAGNETGLQDAAEHFAIGRAADAGMLHPTTVYLAWVDELARRGIPRTRIRQDDVIWLSTTTTLRALSPPQTLYPGGAGTGVERNDLILRLDTPGLRVLLLGGADDVALDALAFSGEPLAADVVELALPPDTGIDLWGPLGAVLLAAHPRLIVVAQAPAPAGSRKPATLPTQPLTITPPDTATAQALGAYIVRTASAGTVSLAQRPDGGWNLLGG